MNYLQGYPTEIIERVERMLDSGELKSYLEKKYPQYHHIKNDGQLQEYVKEIKQQKLRKTPPVKQIRYDTKITRTHGAFGLNAHMVKAHGKKLKTEKNIIIASLFREVPLPFLEMIVAHELAHLREFEHNKAFYQLCDHICADYAQIEFDFRLYLTLQERQEQ